MVEHSKNYCMFYRPTEYKQNPFRILNTMAFATSVSTINNKCSLVVNTASRRPTTSSRGRARAPVVVTCAAKKNPVAQDVVGR